MCGVFVEERVLVAYGRSVARRASGYGAAVSLA